MGVRSFGAAGLAVMMFLVHPNTARSAEAGSDALEEIVVTAQKREQAAQDVPVSLFALSGATLEQQGITSIEELGNSLAGVNVASINPGQMRLTIRGAADVSQSNQASSVNGYYIDETSISYVPGFMPELGLWDVERIEVLRGPQGTLFGEGSEGGTLRVITKKPDASQFFGRYQFGGSSTKSGSDGYSALASINAPLQKDVLAMTLAASYRKLPGWIDVPSLDRKDVNDAKMKDARVAFRFTPSEALAVDLSYLINRVDSFDNGATSPGTLDPAEQAPGSGGVNATSPVDADLDIGALTFSYNFGAATLVSASAYTKQKSFTDRDFSAGMPLFFGDPSATGHQTYDTRSRAFTQELRLVSNGEQKLDWTVGAYYKDEKRGVGEGDFFNIPAFGGLQDLLSTHSVQKGDSWAVFGDIDLALTEMFSVQAGLRYFSEDKDFRLDQLTSSVLFGTTAGDFVVGSDKAKETSPKLGVSLKMSDQVMLFAKAAKGFRGGGANTAPLAQYPYASADYNPDSLWSYEVGIKTTPKAGWYANLYVYHNDWKDLQLPFRTADNIFTYTDNAGSATSKGAELEVGGRLAEGLSAGITYSYTDSKIDDDVFDEGGNLVAAGGSRIPQTPKSKFAITTSYTGNLTEKLQGHFDGRYRQQSSFFSDSANFVQNGRSKLLYLSLGISGKWGRLSVFGDNLLDRNDTLAKYPPIGALPYLYINYVRPRNYGLEYKNSF